MSITYFYLFSMLQISFSTFPIFFLTGKNGKSLRRLNNFFGDLAST